MATQNKQLIVDLGKIKLTDDQQKKLNQAIHITVSKQLKSVANNNKSIAASPSLATPSANGITANLTVTFTEVDPKLSTLNAICNGETQTIHQSDTITFNNVKSGKRIRFQGNSSGLTTITIDIEADPTQLNFDKGKINGGFFIK